MKQSSPRWVIRLVCWSVVLSVLFTFASTAVLEGAGYGLSFIVLFLFILLGILFDMVAVAATSADEKPFHSMAAHRAYGSKEALRLVRNADRVATFCADVVGDITGIISGSTITAITLGLVLRFSAEALLIQVVISALVVGLTIGGKAVGKRFAMQNNTKIILFVARLICRKDWFLDKLHLRRRK